MSHSYTHPHIHTVHFLPGQFSALFRSKWHLKSRRASSDSVSHLPGSWTEFWFWLCFESGSFFFSFSSCLLVVPATDLRTLGPGGPPRPFLLLLLNAELPSRPTGSSVVRRRLERIREWLLLLEGRKIKEGWNSNTLINTHKQWEQVWNFVTYETWAFGFCSCQIFLATYIRPLANGGHHLSHQVYIINTI